MDPKLSEYLCFSAVGSNAPVCSSRAAHHLVVVVVAVDVHLAAGVHRCRAYDFALVFYERKWKQGRTSRSGTCLERENVSGLAVGNTDKLRPTIFIVLSRFRFFVFLTGVFACDAEAWVVPSLLILGFLGDGRCSSSYEAREWPPADGPW